MENKNTQTNIRFWNDILTKDECDRIIEICKPAITDELEKVGNSGELVIRKAQSIWLDEYWLKPNDSDLVVSIKKRISELSGKPIDFLERFHVVRYGVGDYFLPHYDFFAKPSDEMDAVHALPDTDDPDAQRDESWLIYLNDDFVGGGTVFQKEDISVRAKQGSIVSWNNVLDDGSPNLDSLHSGSQVGGGEKWIALIWIRNKTYKKNKEHTDYLREIFKKSGYFNT
jgi:prolyl 4-hydroxylase